MKLKFVVFGLSMSSSWGNGHATLWRGLTRELSVLGHEIVFFEHDLPYYARHRDLLETDYCRLVLYPAWENVEARARAELDDADVAIVTSFCPDAIRASSTMFGSRVGMKIFYDLDTPVTLSSLETADGCPYIGDEGLGDFDVVLSFTGGRALDELSNKLGARRTLTLFGWADPIIHTPKCSVESYTGLLSYLGTHADDRRKTLEDFLCEPARRLPADRFILAGALYPADFEPPPNVKHFGHIAPGDHGAFFSSSRFTLNVTRKAMKEYGWCPSGRLFEAAASGATIISDDWLGLDAFFEPQREILIAKSTDDVLGALRLSEEIRRHIGEAARQRTLGEHTARDRARSLVSYILDLPSDEVPTPAKGRGEHDPLRIGGTRHASNPTLVQDEV